MSISSSTVVKANIATLVAVLTFLATASWWVFGYAAQVDQNTKNISSIVQSLEVSRISDDIQNLKTERRDLQREQRADPDNENIASSLDEVNDDLEEAIATKECILDESKPICE